MTMNVIPQESAVNTVSTPKAHLSAPVIQDMNLSIKPTVWQTEVSERKYHVVSHLILFSLQSNRERKIINIHFLYSFCVL